MKVKVLSVSYSEVPTERISKNFIAPKKFEGVCVVTTRDGKRLLVEVEAVTTSAGPALKTLRVEPADPDQHLRSGDVRVPTGTILEQVVKHAAYRETVPPTGSVLEYLTDRSRDSLGEGAQGKIYRRTSHDEMEAIEVDWERIRARPGKLDLAHYRSWAEAYKKVMETTTRPIEALHELTGIPKSTIGRYIVKAREMELLPPTNKGEAKA